MGDQLLLVAVRTDQPEIHRRIQIILNACQPVEPRGAPVAWAKDVDELDDTDVGALRALLHEDDLRRLEIPAILAALPAERPAEVAE